MQVRRLGGLGREEGKLTRWVTVHWKNRWDFATDKCVLHCMRC